MSLRQGEEEGVQLQQTEQLLQRVPSEVRASAQQSPEEDEQRRGGGGGGGPPRPQEAAAAAVQSSPSVQGGPEQAQRGVQSDRELPAGQESGSGRRRRRRVSPVRPVRPPALPGLPTQEAQRSRRARAHHRRPPLVPLRQSRGPLERPEVRVRVAGLPA
ncbi:uncharacterized protein M6B38_293445 [Iris pallida]|uniref:Uncharacterized protein n=1 Tax=Iris pallida TaxID=29817 RepID=A0AAX6HU67_IRIPA|nr:uncharacterized protein M6B38_293445 [Iris pallida]